MTYQHTRRVLHESNRWPLWVPTRRAELLKRILQVPRWVWTQEHPIAHCDDFRWFGPAGHIHEWKQVIRTFDKHGFEVPHASDIRQGICWDQDPSRLLHGLQFIDPLRFQTGANADFKFCIGQISTSLFICLSQKVSLCMMKRLKSQDVYFQSGKIGHRSTKIQLRPWNRMNKFPTVEDNEPRKTHDDITRKYRMNAGSNVVTLFPPRSCFRVSICFVQ